MNPFEAGAALHQPSPPSHISSARSTGKDGTRVRMNVATHQKKEMNEKTGKKEAGEERKRVTNSKEAACYPSVVVQGAARRKNGLCEGSAQNNWDSRKGQQRFRSNSNGVGDCTTTLRRLLIGAIQHKFAPPVSDFNQ